MNWNLGTFDAVEYGDYVWFSCLSFNGLFRIKKDNKEVEFVGFFPDEKVFVKYMYKKCFFVDGNIIFIPSYAKNIQIYNTETEDFMTIKYPVDEMRQEYDKVSDAILIDKYIYIFPINLKDGLKRFDIVTHEIDDVTEFVEQASGFDGLLENGKVYRCTKDDEYNVYFALYGTDIIAEWNVKNNKLCINHCRISNLFSVHVIDNTKYVIRNKDENIYSITPDGDVVKYIGGEESVDAIDRAYNQIVEYSGTILLLPSQNKSVRKILSDSVEKVFDIANDNNIIISFGFCSANGELWVLPFGKEECYVLNNNLTLSESFSFVLKDNESQKEILNKIIQELNAKEIVEENSDLTLREYLEALKADD